MAEKKNDAPKKVQHTFTAADGSGSSTEKPPVNATYAGAAQGKAGAKKYRIGAILLWLAGLILEVVAILALTKVFKLGDTARLIVTFGALALDLACVLIGSSLWKKSNRFDPASEKDKVKFFLWNNMGVIASVIDFLPFLILAITNKNDDKKMKIITIIVAAVALLAAGLGSAEWHPYSAEQQASDMAQYATVYWTKSGTVYHLSPDCGHLNHSEELMYGTPAKAAEEGKDRVCKDCEKKFAAENPGNVDVDGEEPVPSDAEDTAEGTEEVVDFKTFG